MPQTQTEQTASAAVAAHEKWVRETVANNKRALKAAEVRERNAFNRLNSMRQTRHAARLAHAIRKEACDQCDATLRTGHIGNIGSWDDGTGDYIAQRDSGAGKDQSRSAFLPPVGGGICGRSVNVTGPASNPQWGRTRIPSRAGG